MKKILILLVLALMVTAFLAADVTASWIWSDTFPGKAGVPVSLDTTGTFQAEIGFTTTGADNNEADQSIGEDLTAVENTGIVLKVDKATGKAYYNYNDGTVDTNDIFATWLIKSGENLKVFLYADGPLKSGDKEIGWKLYDKNKVYVNCLPLEDEVGVSSGETVTTPPTANLYIYEHEPTVAKKKIKNYGSVELTVETESVWDKSAGEYKANLYMVIVSEGEGGTI